MARGSGELRDRVCSQETHFPTAAPVENNSSAKHISLSSEM